MTGAKRYTVACLAGDGTGPELMAEASRALAAVGGLHGFDVDEAHVLFGGEALIRSGSHLPAATRSAYLEADAVLVGAAREPVLATVVEELDLRAVVTWIRFAPDGDVVIVSPLSESATRWAVERAFAIARCRRATVASIHQDLAWRKLVEDVAEGHDGVDVDHLSVAAGFPAMAFETERFDVVVTGSAYADAFVEVAASPERGPRVLAAGRLAQHGPGVFAPAHGAGRTIAGQGVANPSSMLLATALMLAEGLGERSAADTLADAVMAARGNGTRTFDLVRRGVAATTREFTAAVMGALPSAVRNAEFVRGATSA